MKIWKEEGSTMAGINKIRGKDVRMARIASACFSVCPVKKHCLLIGHREKPCPVFVTIPKVEGYNFPGIKYKGDCPILKFRNNLAATPLLDYLEATIEIYQYDFCPRPTLDNFLFLVTARLYAVYAANGNDFPKFTKKQLDQIVNYSSRKYRDFCQKKSRMIFNLNQTWYEYLVAIEEAVNLPEDYIDNEVLISSVPVIIIDEREKKNKQDKILKKEVIQDAKKIIKDYNKENIRTK
jgi:hypothetical protein